MPRPTNIPAQGTEFSNSRRMRGRLGWLLVVTSLVFIWFHWPRSHTTLPTLFSPPVIAELTQAELSALPQDQLLQRLFDESMRRMYAARRGWRSGPEILPRQLYPLWVAGYLEELLLAHGLGPYLAMEQSPGTPASPSLAQLADAYDALGIPDAAQALREALTHDVSKASESGTSTSPYGALQARFRKALGGGSESVRLRYALAKRATLLSQDE